MCICPKISVLSLGFSVVTEESGPDTFLVPLCVDGNNIRKMRYTATSLQRRPGSGRNLLEQNTTSYGTEKNNNKSITNDDDDTLNKNVNTSPVSPSLNSTNDDSTAPPMP